MSDIDSDVPVPPLETRETPPRPRHPRRRRLIRIAGVALGILLTLFIGILIAIHTPPAKHFVLARVREYLASQQIDFQADSLDYNLLNLSVVLDRIVVRGHDLPDAPPFARIGHVEAKLSLADLIRGSYVVEHGAIRDADVHLLIDAQGRSNEPKLSPSSNTESSGTVDYLIQRFDLTNATVRYEDQRQQLDATLPVASISVTGERPTRLHHVQMNAGHGVILLQGRKADIDRLQAALSFDPQVLTIERVDLAAAGSTVSLAATAIKFNDPQYDFSMRATLDLARLAALANVNEQVNGIVTADVNLRGPLTAIAVRTKLQGDDLSVRTLKQLHLGAELNYDAGVRQAQLIRLDLNAPVGSARADGVVSLDPRSGQSHLNADIHQLDALAVSQALASPYGAASKVDGHVNAEWPTLDVVRATGAAHLTLTPIRSVATRGTVPVAGTLDVKTQGNTIVADAHGVKALGTAVNGHVIVTDPTAKAPAVAGTVQARAGDLAAVIASAEAFLGRARGSLVGTPVKGQLAIDATLGGTTAAPTVDATLAAPSLAAGTVTGLAVTAAARYTPDRATLTNLDATWQTARVHASGDVGLTGAQPLALTATVEQLPVDAVLAALDKQDLQATGIVSMQAHLAGTVAQPSGNANVSLRELKVADQTYGNVTVDATLAQGRAHVEAAADTLKVAAKADVATTAPYAGTVDATIDGLDLKSLPITLQTAPLGGSVSAHLTASGPLATPLAASGTAKIDVRDLQVGNADYGNMNMDAALQNGRAEVHAGADKFKLKANAAVATAAPYAGTVDVAIDGLDLKTLPMTQTTPVTGSVTAHLTASGPLTTPFDGTAAVTLDPLALTYNDQPITTEGVSTIRYAERTLAIDRLVAHAQDSTISINGTLPLEDIAGASVAPAPNVVSNAQSATRTAAASATGATPAAGTREGTINIDAKANLATLAAYAPPDAKVKAEGAVSLTGTVRGTLRRIDPTLTLSVDNASIGAEALKQQLSNVGLHATIEGGALHATDLHASWGDARFTASAEVPFGWLPENLPIELPRQTGAAQVHAKLTGLDLATVPGAPEKLTGTVSVNADVEAPRPDISALSGRVTFPDLHLDFDGLTLAQKDPSAIAFDGGSVTVEKFALDGTVGHVELSGRAGLIDPRPIDLVARANINAAAATVFAKQQQLRIGGQTTLELTAKGTAAQPNLKGFVELANGRVALANPQIAAQGLQVRIDFTPDLITLARLEGNLNGGTLSGSGTVALSGATLRGVDLTLKANDVGLDVPMNLRSQSNADIHITQRGDDIVVGGLVTVQEGGLTDDINLDSGLFAYVNARPSLDLTEQRNPLLERVKLDLRVKTATPILVDNNLARADIDADLRVVGTAYETGMSGRMELQEGSELILNERTYSIQRGVITFIDDRRIVPSLDILMTTRARRYDVTIQATGTPDDMQTTLTSTPTLAQPDILALLVTGKTLDEMRGEEFEVARNQVLSYLGGRVGSTIGRSLQRATGLSTVRIEPNLIASEAEPSARLTVGQDLTPDLSLVYSTDLVNSSDQIWLTEYDITRQFRTRAVRQNDGSFRFDFRHDVRFGGTPEAVSSRKRKDAPKIGTLSVVGAGPVPEEQVRQALKFRPGDTYDYFVVRQAVRRLNALYEKQNRLQSRARVERVVKGQQVDLTVRITPGPVVTLVFDGFTPPKSLVNQARTIWHRGVFDTQRADDVRDALKVRLVDERYLDAKIEYTFDTGTSETPTADTNTNAERRVTFHVEPGTRFDKVTLAFSGASGLKPNDLEGIIKTQKLGPKVFTDPETVTTLLQRVYREQGYLDATLDAPEYDFDTATRQARVIVPVHEGPQFKIRHVEFAGNKVYPAPDLAKQMPSVAGDPYLPASAENSLTKLRQLYWTKGYNDVKPAYQVALDHNAGVLDLQFAIHEGQRSIVASVEPSGNQETSPTLVRAEVEVKEGEPLDLSALARSRKNLYGTGAFSLVDITREEAGEAPAAPAPAAVPGSSADADAAPFVLASAPVQASVTLPVGTLASAGSGGDAAGGGQVGPVPALQPNDVPVRVKVQVREIQPFQLQYGASFDTERGPGVIFNIANHNSLGKAREVGLQTRYDSQVKEARAYMSQPTLREFPIATIASIYYRTERNPSTASTEEFNIDRMGVSIQEQQKLSNHYVWSYGYRFERSREWATNLVGSIPPFTRISPLTSTLTRDTRDDVLDATQGSFLSHAFEFSPEWLGADAGYLKYFAQYFRYFPLQPPKRKQFTNEILRPRLVYAAGVRLGLSHGLGNDVPITERFLAGGSTTLRGFGQNSLGPIGANGVPLGGEGLLVINNELRFPLIWLFDGVTFVDIGNVYPHITDFSLSDLRKSGGIGLRMRTPWFLIRVDYGVPFDRRTGESKSRVFFSIGQAF